MSNNDSPMHEYFNKIGLDREVTDLYLALRMYGPQSLLQLARHSKVERTRVYRLIDTLVEYQLIEIEEHYKRKIYKAAPIGNLQMVLAKRDQEIRGLQQELLEFQKAFEIQSEHSALTHVQFYKGSEGVKQMFWNQTKSNSEIVSVLYENIQSKTNLAFFERWVDRCNERDIHNRSIVSDHFLASQRTWYDAHANEKLKHWQGRYVSGQTFAIKHSMFTYDNVLAYFNWHDKEIFGIEIYNQEIADTQRQFFELLWQQAAHLPDHGETTTNAL
jgi:sugar-specific transcriptional regulator TrmB